MADRSDLLRLLVRVRRRLRGAAAVEGGVAGVVVFLVAATVALVTVRGARLMPYAEFRALFVVCLPLGLTGAATAGMLVAALRRIPLARCARAVDGSVGRPEGARNGDRTRIALALLDAPSGAFVDAAIRDAVRAATPSAAAETAAAPWRRPRGLGWAATLGGAAAVLLLWPAPKVPASMGAGRPVGVVPGRLIPAALLGAEREAAERALRAAAALNDPALRAAATALNRLLKELSAGDLSVAATLDRLAAMEKETARLAAEVAALRKALQGAGEKLAAERETRAAGEAMKNLDADGAQQTLQDLAERAGQMKTAEREKLADTLSQAAADASGARDRGGRRQDGEPEQRRLSRSPEEESGATKSEGNPGAHADDDSEPERQLSRLERNLEDAADRCREDPAACERSLRRGAGDMPQASREAQKASPRRALSDAINQLRQRMSREGQAQGQPGGEGTPQQSMERRFEEAARSGEGAALARPGNGAADKNGAGGTPSGTVTVESQGATERSGSAGGNGIGDESGSDPLGGRASTLGARGRPVDAKVASGAGPTRSQTIESGARAGFARAPYERVFQDYSAAVEETLDTTAVPAGRRYLVRRYFQLIRPRSP